jgi:hypothetical protein
MTEAEKPAAGAEREEGEVAPSKEADDKAPGPAAKHPLEHKWTLWFDNPQQKGKGGWGSSLKSIYTFGTVEDFWWCVIWRGAVNAAHRVFFSTNGDLVGVSVETPLRWTVADVLLMWHQRGLEGRPRPASPLPALEANATAVAMTFLQTPVCLQSLTFLGICPDTLWGVSVSRPVFTAGLVRLVALQPVQQRGAP